ncbi:MAG: DUF5074 domain-containing protein [Chitinophagaceae bacterium]
MYKGILTSLILAFALVLGSCSKDPIPAPIPNTGIPVFVVCEGAYGNGNSALTAYNLTSNTAEEDIYQRINGQPLGDVFQSMMRSRDSNYFLCINNSDKIIILDKRSLLKLTEIAVPKPRYIVQVSDTKAYVSTLYNNKVYIINPKTFSVSGTISLPFKNPEGMLLLGDKVFVCPWDTAANAIFSIDTATDIVSSPIPVSGRAPQEIVQDNDGMIWVLSGNKADGVEGKLTRLNPATGAVLKTFSFGNADPLRLVFNPEKTLLYFIEVSYSGSATNNGLYRMGIDDSVLPSMAFIPASGLQYFWGLGIDPFSGNIYLSDPVGFTQRGKVYVYQPDCTLVNSFMTGVGPGHFLF